MMGQSGEKSGVVRQRTLKNSIHCSGVGLHSGARVSMVLHPAPAGSGIRFRRSDRPGSGDIAATWENAIETPLCSTLVAADGARILTIEHLMSALAGCAIDNALIELNGAEVPVMDGSAAPFVFLIECAGTQEQAAARRALRIRKHVRIGDGERSASLTPGSGFSINFEIDFESPAVARQEWFLTLDRSAYKREVARARTFGFLHDVDKLRAMGLARGGTLDNAVVISGDRILNHDGLRYDNEFVRHKVLDSIGDLYLAGGPIVGHFHGLRSGHALTLRMLRTLFDDPEAWCWTRLTEADLDSGSHLAGAATPPARAVAARA